MQTKEFFEKVEIEILNNLFPKVDRAYLEVIPVWYCKTIQNHKGIFIIRERITNFLTSHFIEATYNGDKNELYLDDYQKIDKYKIKIEDNS